MWQMPDCRSFSVEKLHYSYKHVVWVSNRAETDIYIYPYYPDIWIINYYPDSNLKTSGYLQINIS